MDYAFKFYESTSVASEQSYAYTGRDGSCKSSYTTAIPQGGVTGYKDISSESPSSMPLRTLALSALPSRLISPAFSCTAVVC
jgi:hypothetical protein